MEASTPAQEIKTLVGSYTNSEVAFKTYEARLHDLWYACTQAAKVTPADDPAMDRLVLLDLAERGRGPVSRILSPTERLRDEAGTKTKTVVEHAIFPAAAASSGSARLFTDLPFLVSDLLASWKTILIPTSSSSSFSLIQHHRNLASSTACLVGLGACRAADGRDRLVPAALWLVRAAIEDSNNENNGERCWSGWSARDTRSWGWQ